MIVTHSNFPSVRDLIQWDFKSPWICIYLKTLWNIGTVCHWDFFFKRRYILLWETMKTNIIFTSIHVYSTFKCIWTLMDFLCTIWHIIYYIYSHTYEIQHQKQPKTSHIPWFWNQSNNKSSVCIRKGVFVWEQNTNIEEIWFLFNCIIY